MAHDDPHRHDHGTGDRHDHDHGHGPGHNLPHGLHLHSHMEEADAAADLKDLTAQFIEGFAQAKDKASYLRLAGIPYEIDDPAGGPRLKLVDVALTTEWQVGTASPSFGSRELSYLPYPADMIHERANLAFVYVSLDAKIARDLRDFLQARERPEHHHPHSHD